MYLRYVICEQRLNYLRVFNKIHYRAQKYSEKLELIFLASTSSFTFLF